MTKTITGRFAEQPALDAAVKFLATEYGMPDTDILIQPVFDEPNSSSTQLTVDVNDDEVDEISEALTMIGGLLEVRA